MGIGASDLRRLIELRRTGHIPDGSSVVEIGAQQLDDGFLASTEELEQLRRAFNVEQNCPLPNPLAAPALDGRPPRLDPGAPWARDFWNWLGLSYAAIDIDGSPGSIPLDLNYDEIPAAAKSKYQLVTNFGTTEHVANQLNAFKIIHDLTAPGGIMIHTLPAQGMFNHGLVNYNPKFFWMLGRSNAYKFLHMSFFPLETSEPLPTNIVDYVSGFVPEFSQRVEPYRAADCSLSIAMQKIVDTGFVAPLDVNTGTRTDDETLKRRYWTVFEPVALDTLTTLNGKIDAAVQQSAGQSEAANRRLEEVAKQIGAVAEQLASQSEVGDRRLYEVIQQLAGQAEVMDRRLDAVCQQLVTQSEGADRHIDALVQQLATQSEATQRHLLSVVEQWAAQTEAVDRHPTAAARQLATQTEVTDRRPDAVVQLHATQSEVLDRHLFSVVQQLAAQAAMIDRRLESVTQQLASQAEVGDQRLDALTQQIAGQAQAVDRHLGAAVQQLAAQTEIMDRHLSSVAQQLTAQAAMMDRHLGGVTQQLASQAEVIDRRLDAMAQQAAAQAQAIDHHLDAVAERLKVQSEVLDRRLHEAAQGLIGQFALLNEKLGEAIAQSAKPPRRSLWQAIRPGRKPSGPDDQ